MTMSDSSKTDQCLLKTRGADDNDLQDDFSNNSGNSRVRQNTPHYKWLPDWGSSVAPISLRRTTNFGVLVSLGSHNRTTVSIR
jgi:hypothetical protein